MKYNKINLKNIAEGQVVKNYKDMCKLLGDITKEGNSRKSQLEDWQRYFEYKKDGHKFIITKIYDSPLEKVESRGGQNAIYVKFIELLLMYELSKRPGYTCNYTKTNLCHLLGLVNDNYLRNNRSEARKSMPKIDNWQINQFFNRVDGKLKDVLFSALNSMKRRCLITYTEQYIIVTNVCDNNSDMHNAEYKVASKKEMEMILSAKSVILKQNGWSCVPFNKMDIFYSLVNGYLKEKYGWNSVYREYEIVYTREHMDYGIKNATNELKALILKSKIELNTVFLDAINRQASTLYKKNQSECESLWLEILNEDSSEENNEERKYFEFPGDYEYNQEILADVFVKLL